MGFENGLHLLRLNIAIIVIPAEEEIHCYDWMPDQVRHDDL